MRYVERETQFPDVSYKTAELISSDKVCGRLFGLQTSENGLVPAWGFAKLQAEGAPQELESCYVTYDGGVYIYGDGLLYSYDEVEGVAQSTAAEYSQKPFVAEYTEGEKTYYLCTDGQNSYIIGDGQVSAVEYMPLSGAVEHHHRIFGIDKDDEFVIRWAAAGDMKNYEQSAEDAGYIRLNGARGRILNLVTYGDSIIAVREYGLNVIKAFGSPENFTVEVTDTDADEIIKDTAVVCYDRLFFYTRTGLCAFDGNKISSFCKDGLTGFNSPVCAAAYAGCVFLCGQLDGEYAIACIDAKEESVSYMRVKSQFICAAKRAFFVGDGVYELLPAESGEWESGDTDFGSAGNKYLKELFVDGEVDSLTVSTENAERTFGKVSGRVNVRMSGQFFKIKLSCKTLRGLSAVYLRR